MSVTAFGKAYVIVPPAVRNAGSASAPASYESPARLRLNNSFSSLPKDAAAEKRLSFAQKFGAALKTAAKSLTTRTAQLGSKLDLSRFGRRRKEVQAIKGIMDDLGDSPTRPGWFGKGAMDGEWSELSEESLRN